MKRPAGILTLAAFFLTIGIAIAYYNTSSFGYDDANIISFNSEEINLFDYNIKFEDVEETIEAIKKKMPQTYITIGEIKDI